MKIRYKIGLAFIAVQIVLVAVARFVPERFFCWAPYDEHTYIDVSVVIDGKQLTKKEIENRYRYKSEGWEPRSVNNLFNIIEQYESTYGEDDNAIVQIKYATNGNKERTWNLRE